MDQEIKDAYNLGAEVYRKQYDHIPPRAADVDAVHAHVGKDNPLVVEIGCGYGREAEYILTKTKWYQGIDISDRFIEMAQAKLGEEYFHCEDVLDYEWPKGLDVVFAFASLLHCNKEDLFLVLCQATAALQSRGVIFLSLKRSDQYETRVEDDGVSKRRYYYYDQETVRGNIPENLEMVLYQEQSREEDWFTMILQKQ